MREYRYFLIKETYDYCSFVSCTECKATKTLKRAFRQKVAGKPIESKTRPKSLITSMYLDGRLREALTDNDGLSFEPNHIYSIERIPEECFEVIARVNNLMRTDHLTKEQRELVEEIKSYETGSLKSDFDILCTALILLRDSERSETFKQLGAAMRKHYEENPEEIE